MRVLFQLVTLLLAAIGMGCSTCTTIPILNVRLETKPLQMAEVEAANYATRLLVDDTLDLLFALCGERPKQGLCLWVRVAPGKRMVFTKPTYRLVLAGLPAEVLAMPRIEYDLSCTVTMTKRDCSSSEASPTSSSSLSRVWTRQLHQKDSILETWKISFDASAEFVGAESTSSPTGLRLFSQFERWRPYRLVLNETTVFGSEGGVLTLPPFTIEGATYSIPGIRAFVAPTRVCPVSA